MDAIGALLIIVPLTLIFAIPATIIVTLIVRFKKSKKGA